MMKDTQLDRTHMRSPRNQQDVCSRITPGISRRPTRKSDTAKERRKRLVGVWSCLEEKRNA